MSMLEPQEADPDWGVGGGGIVVSDPNASKITSLWTNITLVIMRV